jgi:CoA:oxalate CoA-transferase
MVLSDLGAEVVKVERPPYGDQARTVGPFIDGESVYFFSINRGKKSISLDLRSDEGKQLFLGLVEKFDVVMENFTPGTMAELGLGYETLRERNPGLIYAATSGFGQTGPDRLKPALDIIVQGMGGIMSITGEPGGRPVRPGASLGDITAGLFTAVGILSALYERSHSGLGQFVDISMLDAQIAILENAYSRYFATGEVPQPLGTRHPSATPFQAFPTKDGYIVLAMRWGVSNQWALFCALIERLDLIDDPRFQDSTSRTQHHAVLEPMIEEALRQRTTAEWLKEFEAIDMPCGPLNTIPQAAQSPQLAARNMFVPVEHPVIGTVKLPNTPVKLSRTPGGISGPSPDIGQSNAEVLGKYLGMAAAEIARLEEAGTVFRNERQEKSIPAD